jgi:enoyl-CoA hydratase
LTQLIEREERDGIVTLRLAHGKASAMDVELLQALIDALEAASDAHAIVLTGTGSIFCAGVDLFRMTNEGAPYVERFFPLLRDAIAKLFGMPVPVVAAANGHAIAGGCILVCACDYRLMADGNGRIGVPELLVGVPFPEVALKVMQFAVPNVAPLVMTGRTMLPQEARTLGLIDEVVEPAALMDRAFAMAAQLASIPRESFRMTKQTLRGFGADDGAAQNVWSDPAIHQHIREYLARTVKK